MSKLKIRLVLVILVLFLLAEGAWIVVLRQRIKELEFGMEAFGSRASIGRRPPPPDPTALTQGKMPPHLVRLLEINKSLHREDRERYGEAVHGLYLQALVMDRGPVNPADRVNSEKALSRLIEEYPEANATAMAIADRALEAAMRRKTSDVEFYFKMLSKQKNHQGIVTDKGVEAYSSLLLYLTRNYIRDGRLEKAEELIRKIESDYSDKLVADRDQSGEPDWRPGSEIAKALRRELASAQAEPATGQRPGG
ncbi:MAG TPA: hypothetical protein DEO88_14315 [Syntrophobacteraceae bacterium]|nr:hypothetical protein [Syntrophobacteraceae bacterium]